MRFEFLSFWRLPRKEPQERLVLRLDLLAGYAEDFGSFSGPGTDDVFTLAIVIVGGIVVAQPLGAIAHFSHRPHAGGECQKTIVSVKYQKDQKESLEQRRNTPNSGG
jgi:hypothetical protein